MWNNFWRDSAHCLTTEPDALFGSGAAQHEFKLICRTCTVKLECLADALDGGMEYGVWGGLTERERRSIVARRPNVRSWKKLLHAAKESQTKAA